MLSAAFDDVLRVHPGARLVIAGPGSVEQARERMSRRVAEASEFLGLVTDADKAALFASADVYAAPQTGGESFGIVEPAGRLFANEDARALGAGIVGLLGDPAERQRFSAAGRLRAADFDWSVVAEDILAVYETVAHAGGR